MSLDEINSEIRKTRLARKNNLIVVSPAEMIRIIDGVYNYNDELKCIEAPLPLNRGSWRGSLRTSYFRHLNTLVKECQKYLENYEPTVRIKSVPVFFRVIYDG